MLRTVSGEATLEQFGISRYLLQAGFFRCQLCSRIWSAGCLLGIKTQERKGKDAELGELYCSPPPKPWPIQPHSSSKYLSSLSYVLTFSFLTYFANSETFEIAYKFQNRPLICKKKSADNLIWIGQLQSSLRVQISTILSLTIHLHVIFLYLSSLISTVF